jgi:hypothetical protein
MNLISCNACGVVLDREKCLVPEFVREDGAVDLDKAYWSGDGYLPKIMCPVCQNYTWEEVR